MVGPLKKVPMGFTHLLVDVDKFTKWIKAKPITALKVKDAAAFFLDIVYRFGVPNSIITDNGKQFTSDHFLHFCDDWNIRVNWAAVYHPRINGQVERANDMILQGLKPQIFDRLRKFGTRWATELPAILWSLRMTPSRATDCTPFYLAYSAEAMLPIELEYGSPRVQAYDEGHVMADAELSVDLLDEARDAVVLRSTKYQQDLRRYHDRTVRDLSFNVGDLVLRRATSTKDRHKLSPPWEGPYIIAEVLRPGAYKIKDADGNVLTNAWNIEKLRKFYP
jgi:hypothetical protein